MKILEGLSQYQIENFASETNDTAWLVVNNETCILYGVGRFNNPTNLPVYHTHDKGGIIVCFPGDICFTYISDTNNGIGIRFLIYMQQYLSLKGQAVIANNDLLYNGRKVLSYSKIQNNNKYIFSFHISMGMDLPLVRSVCTKPAWKIPGGLIKFGYTQKEILDKTTDFLQKEEEKKQYLNGPIDICVMWVDPSSQRWQEQYKKYKQLEISQNIQSISNEAAFNTARYQNWGIFKYWFRGVEQNCPWVNKVFLIVEDEDQIPSWLNRNHPKLRIVFHKDFIPNDLLPLFNGPAIEMWYSNIPDLSENFIACDDDYFFYNFIPNNWFFEANVPQTSIKISNIKYEKIPGLTWHCMMANDRELIEQITGRKYNFKTSHLPEARKKSFEKKILNENYHIIHDAIQYSHFRSEKSYTAWVFIDLMKIYHISEDKPIYNNSRVIPLGAPLIIQTMYKNSCDMICFNDIAGDINMDSQKLLLKILNTHFPNKSSWEV